MTMQKILTVTACLASLTGAAVLFGAANAADTPKPALEQQLQELLKARMETAQVAYDASLAAFDAGNVTLDQLMEASAKLTKAQVDLAGKPEEVVMALSRHVERAKQTEAQIASLFKVGTKGGEAKDYFSVKRERESAEIELLKARIKAIP